MKENMKKYLIILFLLVSLCAFSATYYVDFVGGDDTNNGTSTGTPWQHHPWDPNATDTSNGTALSGGDICYFEKGVTYVGTMVADDSGTKREEGTDGVISADGLTFTSATATFQTNNVAAGEHIYINGEGLIEIASVDSEVQLTLSTACVFKDLANRVYLNAIYIQLTINDAWGSGIAKLQGSIRLTGESYIWIEGNASNELQVTKTNSIGVYINNGAGGPEGFMFRNFDIYDTDGDDQAGLYVRYVKYTLIDGLEISYIGDIDE